jgi:hypothetical protein
MENRFLENNEFSYFLYQSLAKFAQMLLVMSEKTEEIREF